MKTHPILEELWRSKDDWVREAAAHVRSLCENTRRWATAHPHPGPVVKDAAELRAWLAFDESAGRRGADRKSKQKIRRSGLGRSHPLPIDMRPHRGRATLPHHLSVLAPTMR